MLAMLEMRTTPARGGGWMYHEELAYIRKRKSDEEAEKKREQERIEEEAARIERERIEQEQRVIVAKTRKQERLDEQELEQLAAEIELLQAQINLTYRLERERQLAEAQQAEMAAVLLIFMMEA